MAIKIGIDPGHGGADPGAVGMGFNEKDITLEVALKLRDRLKGQFDVVMTRETDIRLAAGVGPDLTARANRLNNAGVDAVISIHMNSAASPARGVETYTWNGNNLANAWGDAIHDSIIGAGLYSANRGRKWANFAILRETYAVACLVEMAFINSNDVYQVSGKTVAWADALASGIRDYFKVSNSNASGTRVIEPETATERQAMVWAKNKGAAQFFVDLVPVFWDIATKKGVNPAGVYAQSAKETGFGNFGGVLDESYKNPCGLKTTAGGANDDPNAHQKFESWEQGITAQVDHLLLYAGYPQESSPDPRHFKWIAGRATTWEALGGNWAPSASYGVEIVRMMRDIESTETASDPIEEVPEWYADDLQRAIDAGITTGERPNDPATRAEVAIMILRGMNKNKL